jgi:hypothetical protein
LINALHECRARFPVEDLPGFDACMQQTCAGFMDALNAWLASGSLDAGAAEEFVVEKGGAAGFRVASANCSPPMFVAPHLDLILSAGRGACVCVHDAKRLTRPRRRVLCGHFQVRGAHRVPGL